MNTEFKIDRTMIPKWTQKETKMNLNLSFSQFSETRLPQAWSGLLPQAKKTDEFRIENKSKNGLHQEG